MNIKKHIPNAITCCNLLCGCLAIVQTFEGNLVNAAYLVGLAAIFDFFDGFAARLLRVASPIGKDLDSLADMVTFGVVPAFIMFKMILMSIQVTEALCTDRIWSMYNLNYFPYIAFIIPVFSAIRLAKFNHDTRQTSSFIGLPTPANAIFICSLILIFNDLQDQNIDQTQLAISQIQSTEDGFSKMPYVDVEKSFMFDFFYKFVFTPYTLSFLSLVFSFLLLAELPLFALKFRNFSWTGNRIRYTFLGLSLILLITLQFAGIPLVIILYVLISVITNFYMKRRPVS